MQIKVRARSEFQNFRSVKMNFILKNTHGRIIKSVAFAVLSLFVSSNLFGQQFNSDSLKRIWTNQQNPDSTRFKAINQYYVNHTHAEPDSVLVLCDYHYHLAQTKNATRELASALNEKSYVYYIKGDIDKSLAYLQRSVAVLQKLNDQKGLAPVYSNMGSIYADRQMYQEAVRYFMLTLELYEKEKIEKGEARILSNLGMTFVKLDRDDLARTYFEKSIRIYTKLGLKERTGSSVLSLAGIYFKEKKYEQAINKTKEALELLVQENDQVDISDCYFLMAKTYKELNELDKAFLYLGKSFQIEKVIKNNARNMERLMLKADLTLGNDKEEATRIAEGILKLIDRYTSNEIKANLYDLLYRCYKAQNKFDLSLLMLEQNSRFMDSVKIEKDNIAIIEAAIQKEFDDKLKQTKAKSESDKNTLKNTHARKIFGIILIVLVVGIIAFFFTRKTIRENRKAQEELLLELEQLKKQENTAIVANPSGFQLNREALEKHLDRKINETDWNVLNILLGDPVLSNKEIAEKAFLSYEGIGSSLRRMYEYFEIKESKYMKISLLMEAIKISNKG